jgi:hypothetical protein
MSENRSFSQDPENGWTFRTIKSYFETLIETRDAQYRERYETSQESVKTAFAALSESTRTAMAAADKAVLKAEAASEKRFESVNEFRGLVTDQQRTFMPRSEAEKAFSGLEEKIDDLKIRQVNFSGERRGSKDSVVYLVMIAGFIVNLIFDAFILLRHP